MQFYLLTQSSFPSPRLIDSNYTRLLNIVECSSLLMLLPVRSNRVVKSTDALKKCDIFTHKYAHTHKHTHRYIHIYVYVFTLQLPYSRQKHLAG